MTKLQFSDLIRDARLKGGYSLRRLAEQAGLDYSRLAKIEAGTRPAPDLMTIRALAELLDLDLADLIVAAGTTREVVEDLVWSERLALGNVAPATAEYQPKVEGKNAFVVPVVERKDGRCRIRLGQEILSVFSFSSAKRLRIQIPPEAVVVFRDDPTVVLGSPENVFRASVRKTRRLGQVVDLILENGDCEINALVGRSQVDGWGPAKGDAVYVLIPPTMVRTSCIEEEEGG